MPYSHPIDAGTFHCDSATAMGHQGVTQGGQLECECPETLLENFIALPVQDTSKYTIFVNIKATSFSHKITGI